MCAIVRPTAAQALTTAATGGEANTLQYLSPRVSVPFASFLLIRDNTAIHDPALPEAFDEPIAAAVAQASPRPVCLEHEYKILSLYSKRVA